MDKNTVPYVFGKMQAALKHIHTPAEHTDPNRQDRIPPGQHTVNHMVAMPPITHDYPHIPRDKWQLRVYGSVERECVWNWDAFLQLPSEEYRIDFHCVTKWSKPDQLFRGVPFVEIVNRAKPKPETCHVIFECADGYTTNVVFDELQKNTAFLAFLMDNAEIEDTFGGPVRAVIPHLYGWKSAKFLTAIRFQKDDEPGFWEVRGYHNHADPWKEERYSQ